ncbi:Uncharacterized protein CTYZ_00002710 [Cryptosporidium tyzzeri]|nr:Uncharacterized protein CTYZ_00002710 [Cryptosporidium tyzzeri]
MLSKEDILDEIILERLNSAISRVSRCMSCKLNKSKYFDIAENILICKRCLKNSQKFKFVGAHKITSKEIDLLEKNIDQLSFKTNKRAGFSFKNFFSKYFGSKKHSYNSILKEKERMETSRLESENYSNFEWNLFSKEQNFLRRSTFDFCSIYEDEKLVSLPFASNKKYASVDCDGRYVFTNENLNYNFRPLDDDLNCRYKNIGYESSGGLSMNCNDKTYEYNENYYITQDHLNTNNKPNVTSKNPFDLF